MIRMEEESFILLYCPCIGCIESVDGGWWMVDDKVSK